MFADANPEQTRPLLYAFGLLMLIFAMILNIIVIIFSVNFYLSDILSNTEEQLIKLKEVDLQLILKKVEQCVRQ